MSEKGNKMKSIKLVMLALFLFACGGYQDGDDPEFGTVDQEIITDQTNGGANRISGAVINTPDNNGSRKIQCTMNLAASAECVVPFSKTVDYFAKNDGLVNQVRAYANSIFNVVQGHVNTTSFSGTAWTGSVAAAGGGCVGCQNSVQFSNDCNAGNPNGEGGLADIRNFYTVDRQNVVSIPNESLPGTFTRHGYTLVRVNGCMVNGAVGAGSGTAFDNVWKHAAEQGLLIGKYGLGVIGSGGGCSDCATSKEVDGSQWKSNMPQWQECLAKVLNVSTPANYTVGTAFKCPTPPNGQ